MKKLLKSIALALSTICIFLVGGCAKETEKITVAMPDGAPAMAFASLMSEGVQDVTFQVITPSVVATKVTNKEENKNADLCVLPVTAASKLLGSGERYQMLSMITCGNLYLLSKDERFVSSVQQSAIGDLSCLSGKKIGVLQIKEMPGLTLKWTIQKYGLEWREIENDGEIAEDKVNLKGISGISDMASNDMDGYLVAEPAASIQLQKGFVSVCSLETLYSGGFPSEIGAYPQAVLMAKTSLIEKNPTFVQAFLDKVESSCAKVTTLSGEQIVESITEHLEDKQSGTSLKANVLTKETIARCGVRFERSKLCKSTVISYLQKIHSVDSKIQTVEEQFFKVL